MELQAIEIRAQAVHMTLHAADFIVFLCDLGRIKDVCCLMYRITNMLYHCVMWVGWFINGHREDGSIVELCMDA